MLALRYEREVIIVGTSILGGILSGFSAAKLAKMEEIPFGIIFSIGFALVGLLIQFAINKPKYDDDYDEDEDLGKVPERRQKREEADWEEAESETKRRGKKERDDKKNPSREQYRKCPEEYEEDLDDDLSEADDKEIDEILVEYGVDEVDEIEEYLEDYYGENKRTPQKSRKNKSKRKNSASPYQKNR